MLWISLLLMFFSSRRTSNLPSRRQWPFYFPRWTGWENRGSIKYIRLSFLHVVQLFSFLEWKRQLFLFVAASSFYFYYASRLSAIYSFLSTFFVFRRRLKHFRLFWWLGYEHILSSKAIWLGNNLKVKKDVTVKISVRHNWYFIGIRFWHIEVFISL